MPGMSTRNVRAHRVTKKEKLNRDIKIQNLYDGIDPKLDSKSAIQR